MRFTELVDIDELRALCEDFTRLTGAVTAILDLDGTILVATGWRDICTRFHRANPQTAARCLESDTALADRLQQGQDYTVYQCRNGLVDVAVPIRIGGEHVANLFTGQFLLDAPDKAFFIRQADTFGFDPHAYMEALARTPVFPAEKVRTTMAFLTRLARVIGEAGLTRRQLLESNSALRASEAIISSSDDAIISKSLDGRVITWNRGATAIFGYTAEEMLGRSMNALLPADRHDEEDRILAQIQNGETVSHFETVRIRKDGAEITISVTISPIRDADGTVIGASKIARDITRQVRAESAARQKDDQFHQAIETSPDGFWITDADGRILDANNAYVRLSGYSRAELLGMNIDALEVDDGADRHTALRETLRSEGVATYEALHRARDGRLWPAEIVASYSDMLGGRLFMFIRDRTEERRATELIWHQANFDRLTDLPNRALLFDRISKACALARRNASFVALLYLDLDGFKPINDRYGHEAGDLVLVTVARRWQACVRQADTVARVGGDEFAVLLGNLGDPGEAAAIADKLLQALLTPIALADGTASRIGASIGVAVFPDNATEMDSLIDAADAAMYQSKAAGKNTVTFSTARADAGPEHRPWVPFDAKSLIGIAEIDNQHRQLVHMANHLNHLARIHTADHDFLPRLAELVSFAEFHFNTEERYMRDYAYPAEDTHRREHEYLTHQLRHTVREFRKGTQLLALQTVKDWLVNHIEAADKPLGRFLSQHGAR